jgi:hypothetical protein
MLGDLVLGQCHLLDIATLTWQAEQAMVSLSCFICLYRSNSDVLKIISHINTKYSKNEINKLYKN